MSADDDGDEDEVTFSACSECGEDVDERTLIYTKHWGSWCKPCMQKRHPGHILDQDDCFEVRDVWSCVLWDGVIVVHHPTGISAFAHSYIDALKLLRKVYYDVTTVERNERYGEIME